MDAHCTGCGELLELPRMRLVIPPGGTEATGSRSSLHLNVSVSLRLIRYLVHRLEGQLHIDHLPLEKITDWFSHKILLFLLGPRSLDLAFIKSLYCFYSFRCFKHMEFLHLTFLSFVFPQSRTCDRYVIRK